jgi:membrane dipeptidase
VPSLEERAARLHREALVLDSHNDVLLAVVDYGFDLGLDGLSPGRLRTHTDLRRMRAGGLDAQFFAVYVDDEFVPRKPSERGRATRRAIDLIAALREQVHRHGDVLELATSSADIRRIASEGRIAALIGIEGGHAIEDDLEKLRELRRLGARYLTLTHFAANSWADSATSPPRHNGLTAFGRKVVAELNRLGMMVDVSHVSPKTVADVLRASRAPIIASHSSARALCDHPRNLGDEELREISRHGGGGGGVVMVNFYDGFLDGRKVPLLEEAWKASRALHSRHKDSPDRAQEAMARWWTERGIERTPSAVLVDHIEHVIRVAGPTHVGLGSDFDGFGFYSSPVGADDVASYPRITLELLRRGHSEEEIRGLLGGNFLRVMAEVERVGVELQRDAPTAEGPR